MAKPKLTDTEIAIRIVPKHLRFPESGTSVAWSTAHHCVNAFKHLVRKVDLACSEVEENAALSVTGITRRRAEICDQALRKLANFPAFETAEKALIANIEALERLSERNPEQVQMLQMLKQALTDLREGIPATQRMVQERCKVRERVFG